MHDTPNVQKTILQHCLPYEQLRHKIEMRFANETRVRYVRQSDVDLRPLPSGRPITFMYNTCHLTGERAHTWQPHEATGAVRTAISALATAVNVKH